MLYRTALILSALALAGCQHQAARPPAGEGRSTFAFVEPLTLGGKKTELVLAAEQESLDVLVAARPVEPLVKPAYPAAARGRQEGPALVGVHLQIDTNGRVTEVAPSMVSFSTPGPYAAAFRAAVEAAVEQWTFTPAKHRRLERVALPDGSVYWRNGGEEKAEATFDVAFTFNEGEVTAPPVR
jgi:hypothetical protein